MKRRYNFLNSYEMGLAIIGGFTAAFAIVCFIRMLSPIVYEKALSKLQSEFNFICNEAVLDYIETENISYKDIVELQQNSDGKIQAVNTDMSRVNKMKSKLSIDIQKEIDKLDTVLVKVPTNGFFGFGGGIDLPVHLISVGALNMGFKSSFESVGINQTRLYINMTIETTGKLLFFGEGQRVKIKTAVPVSQTVIVGDVPNTYLNMDKR